MSTRRLQRRLFQFAVLICDTNTPCHHQNCSTDCRWSLRGGCPPPLLWPQLAGSSGNVKQISDKRKTPVAWREETEDHLTQNLSRFKTDLSGFMWVGRKTDSYKSEMQVELLIDFYVVWHEDPSLMMTVCFGEERDILFLFYLTAWHEWFNLNHVTAKKIKIHFKLSSHLVAWNLL